MEERLKKRLIGAAVLTSLVVIFVPMLFEKDGDGQWDRELRIPTPPATREDFATRILPAPKEDLARAPGPALEAEKSTRMPAIPEAPIKRTAAESAQTSASGAAPALEKRPERDRGPRAWVLQVASFSSRKNAEQLVRRLRAKKFPAFQEQASVNGTTVYRVRIGPEIDRKLAEKMLQRVTEEFKLKGQVVRYP